ncbi:hypothetical protein [Pseudoalteromonas sp. R3]|uniref:hypothetical protein n=1 Tax=Pseudoalteromonas sp. R3 TaxID=1709477 RepID=UPI0006B488FA|nr:hypothetical protein [Pseudoalteromonas sp. R3]AZZ99950.1 hypothetical protein ELR70_24490 [Pseudoalteromonas sp. R3]
MYTQHAAAPAFSYLMSLAIAEAGINMVNKAARPPQCKICKPVVCEMLQNRKSSSKKVVVSLTHQLFLVHSKGAVRKHNTDGLTTQKSQALS